jgi:hypothetical protein
MSGSAPGYAWKVISIVSSTDDDITLILEDEENYNYYIDSVNNNFGGQPQPSSQHIYFELNSDGVPIVTPSYTLVDASLSVDTISRFADRNPNRQYADILQPSHGFLGGEPIWVDPADGLYKSANNTNAKFIVGIVSSVGIPTSDWFTYKAFGTYYYDIQKFFGTLDLSSYNRGDFIYVSTDGVNNYTSTPPTDVAIPVWVYLGLDVNGKQTGILYTTPSMYSGGGGGGGTVAPLYKIAVSYNTGTNSVYQFSSITPSLFSPSFSVTTSGNNILITNTKVGSGLTNALQLLPTAGYVTFATAAASWSAWDANPTFGYKAIATSIMTQINTSTTPALQITTPFTPSGLAGSGKLALNGDSTTRVLAYIYLQFNSAIL